MTPARARRPVRDLYAAGADAAEAGSGRWSTTRISRTWPQRGRGRARRKVGIAPRVFLKKLVADVLDRVDQFADFDPRRHYR